MKAKFIAAATICALSLTGCLESSEERSIRYCQDGKTAYPSVKELISQRLVAPATAEFPSFDEVRHRYLGNCRHQFTGFLDSQNRAGAMLRLNYSITVKAQPASERYSIESFDMNQR